MQNVLAKVWYFHFVYSKYGFSISYLFQKFLCLSQEWFFYCPHSSPYSLSIDCTHCTIEHVLYSPLGSTSVHHTTVCTIVLQPSLTSHVRALPEEIHFLKSCLSFQPKVDSNQLRRGTLVSWQPSRLRQDGQWSESVQAGGCCPAQQEQGGGQVHLDSDPWQGLWYHKVLGWGSIFKGQKHFLS